MLKSKKKIVLLISGGPDSATLAHYAEYSLRDNDLQINALYLRSGHCSDTKEIESANKIIKKIGGRLEITDVRDLVHTLGGGKLLIHSEAAILPFGNMFVLSLTSAYANRIGADEIWIGLHKDDADENIEYTEEFISSLQNVIDSINPNLKIKVPFISLTKHEVFKKGMELKVDYSTTWSCIRGETIHCGHCGACRSRRRAFNLIGVEDPTIYANTPMALETAVHE
jgi:7-cyano-7-deazaguanine synthase